LVAVVIRHRFHLRGAAPSRTLEPP
jgi:hypothetical protein